MPYCCIKSCRNQSAKTNSENTGITYHKFPTDPDLRDQWTRATGRPTIWEPSKSSSICSEHFDNVSFTGSGSKRRLIETAVPMSSADNDGSDIDIDSDDDDDDLTISQIKKSDDSDDNLQIYTKEQLFSKLKQAKEKSRRRTVEIKRLHQQLRRERRKLTIQNKILNDLMEIYNLKPADIAILKAEIIKAEE